MTYLWQKNEIACYGMKTCWHNVNIYYILYQKDMNSLCDRQYQDLETSRMYVI